MKETLNKFYIHQACHFREHHRRLVSFGDMIVDRWEKARLLGFGEGSSIYDNALVLGDVTVGECTWIGPGTVLDGSGGSLKIGSWCSISAGVQIYSHNSIKWAVTMGQAGYDKSAVSIGSGVYIGPNTVISSGVTIGDRVIVGAQSLVNHDLPALTVAWGQPARVVGRIEMNEDGTDFNIAYYSAETTLSSSADGNGR